MQDFLKNSLNSSLHQFILKYYSIRLAINYNKDLTNLYMSFLFHLILLKVLQRV